MPLEREWVPPKELVHQLRRMRDFGALVDRGAKKRRQVAPSYRELARHVHGALKAIQGVRLSVGRVDRATRRFLTRTGELPSVGLLRAVGRAEEALRKLHADTNERIRAWAPPGADERFSYRNVLVFLQKYQDIDKQLTEARMAKVMIGLGLERGPISKVVARMRSALNRLATGSG